MNPEEHALAWATQRKRADETVMISTCPCCKETLAIYLTQTSTVEIVPDTTASMSQLPLAIPNTECS